MDHKLLLMSLILTFVQGQLSAGCNDGDIRIAGGPNEFEGRVEICLEEVWGQVCGSSGWNRPEGEVVCRQQQFNYTDTIPLSSVGNRYGSISNGSFIIDNVMCQGSESRLSDCEYMIARNSSVCPSNLDAQIVCLDPVCTSSSVSSTIRLVGGGTSGPVEVCRVDGRRRGVCANNWDENDARVVCRELGLLENGTDPLPTTGPQFVSTVSAYDNVNCSGDEERLSLCQFDQTTSIVTRCAAAGVVCQSNTSAPTTTTATATIITTNNSKPDVPTDNPIATTETKTPESTPPLTTDSVSMTETTFTDEREPTNLSSRDTLYGVVGGVIGGLVVVVVIVALLVLLIVILTRKGKKKTDSVQNTENFSEHVALSTQPGKSSSNSSPDVASKSDNEYSVHNGGTGGDTTERELVNPLYKTTKISASVYDDQIHQYDYAPLDSGRSSSTVRSTLSPQSPNNYYSTPTPPLIVKSIPQEYSEPAVTGGAAAATDTQGYASLESPHPYDDTMNFSNLDIPQPYETPSSPVTYDVPTIKGTLVTHTETTAMTTFDAREYDTPHFEDVQEAGGVKDVTANANGFHPYATLERQE